MKLKPVHINRVSCLKHSLQGIALSLFLLGQTGLAQAETVNINNVDAQTLATAVVGVGLAKARAIVAYREAHGPFKSVDELSAVQGIGDRILEKIRDQVSLGGADDQGSALAKPEKVSR